MQLHKYRVYIGTKDEKHHKKLPSVLPVFVLGVKKTKGDDMMTPYGKRVRSIVHWPMNMLSHTQWGEILSIGAFLFLCNCVFVNYFGIQFSLYLNFLAWIWFSRYFWPIRTPEVLQVCLVISFFINCKLRITNMFNRTVSRFSNLRGLIVIYCLFLCLSTFCNPPFPLISKNSTYFSRNTSADMISPHCVRWWHGFL